MYATHESLNVEIPLHPINLIHTKGSLHPERPP